MLSWQQCCRWDHQSRTSRSSSIIVASVGRKLYMTQKPVQSACAAGLHYVNWARLIKRSAGMFIRSLVSKLHLVQLLIMPVSTKIMIPLPTCVPADMITVVVNRSYRRYLKKCFNTLWMHGGQFLTVPCGGSIYLYVFNFAEIEYIT